MRVSVIIPNYNGENFLGACLDSLLGQTRRPERVIVVDNGSSDGSREVAARHPLAVEVLALDRNRGFAVGAQRGIQAAADCEVVALLNNDAVADPRWLEAGLKAMAERLEVSIFTSLLLQSHHRDLVDNAGNLYPRDGRPLARGQGQRASGFGERAEVIGPCGGGAFFRFEVFKKIVGAFREDFVSYLEDVELGLRARRHGENCLFIPEAVVYHVGAGTALHDRPGQKPVDSSSRVFLIARNRVRLVALHWPLGQVLAWSPWLIFGLIRSALYHVFVSGQGRSFFQGLQDGARRFPADRREYHLMNQSWPASDFHELAEMMLKGARPWP